MNSTQTNEPTATYMKSAVLTRRQPYYIKYIMIGILASGIGGTVHTAVQGWAYTGTQHAEISTIAYLISVGFSAGCGLIAGALIGTPIAVSTAVFRAQITTILIRRNHRWQFIAPWVCGYGLFLIPALYCFLTLASTPQTTIIGSRGFIATCILTAGFSTQVLSYIRMQIDDHKTTIGPVHLN